MLVMLIFSRNLALPCLFFLFGQLAVLRGKITIYFSFGEWKTGRLREVAVLQVAVLWRYFIKETLGSWQGNDLVAVLERWPS